MTARQIPSGWELSCNAVSCLATFSAESLLQATSGAATQGWRAIELAVEQLGVTRKIVGHLCAEHCDEGAAA